MTNNNARGDRSTSGKPSGKPQGKPSGKPAQQDKRRPDLNLSVQIKTTKGDELVRCGALWGHAEGVGFGGFFNDTGHGNQVRIVLFEPKQGEYKVGHAPTFKVFIELAHEDDRDSQRQDDGREPRKTDLYFAGLMWENRNAPGFNGYVNTNLLTGQKLRLVAMPPKSADEGSGRRDDWDFDRDIPF